MDNVFSNKCMKRISAALVRLDPVDYVTVEKIILDELRKRETLDTPYYVEIYREAFEMGSLMQTLHQENPPEVKVHVKMSRGEKHVSEVSYKEGFADGWSAYHAGVLDTGHRMMEKLDEMKKRAWNNSMSRRMLFDKDDGGYLMKSETAEKIKKGQEDMK